MSYEKEAMSASAIPVQQAQVMREESVVTPYGKPTRIADAMARATAAIGQQNKGGEAQAPEKPAEETVTLSPQIAAIARKEQISRQKEKALKEREAALEAKLAKVARLEAMEAKLAAKDYSVLDEIVDYNAYSQHQIDKLNGSDPQQEALKKLSEEINGLKKSQEENTNKLFEAAVAERRNAATKLLQTDPKLSEFKTRVEKAMPQVKLPEVVTQHILDTWENDSEELSVEKATEEVQEVLIEKAKSWASILEETQAKPVEEKKQLPPMKQGLKTITNQVTAGELTAPRKSLQHMSDAERWAEARRRAEAKLQKQG